MIGEEADVLCQIAEMGAYVKLLEYDNIDGMILLSELSRRRIRSIQKLIRVGRNEVVVVLRVDKEKGWLLCMRHHLDAHPLTSCNQVILICQSEEYRPRISSSVRSDTTRVRWCIQSCDMWQRRRKPQLRSSMRQSGGH